ncbi:autotransporter domain-containing protein [Dyella solisilvae]|uniref:Autotransporter domain-containing protein n=1 Tax=Dyella solisilvae TaxID=1920168 RepID=A0A370K2R3_9GAMM|nr:autotransporter domain-containing protein [Dyella solisilvae]RDI96934.1 autotransporter domain-containing protein [Dyella solisilvae]
MPRIRLMAGAITAALLFSSHAFAANNNFNNVVVFGDSLSDAGNVSLILDPSLQTPQRFTTNPGSTAAENVAKALGFPTGPSIQGGTDYAYGGAGFVNNATTLPILNIPQQMQQYFGITGGKADPHTLYQMWGGANDIFYLTGAYTDANVISAGAIAAAQTEVKLLGNLQAAGAKYVVVYNLPDIGKTPESIAAGAATQAAATQLSIVYNNVLQTGISQLSNNGLNIIPANTFLLIDEVAANPGAFGFTNVTDPACGAGSSSVVCGPQGATSGLFLYHYPAGAQQTYLFADGVHPTTQADVMLGQYVMSIINAPGYASLLAEAPLSSIDAQNRTIRNQMLADAQGSDTRVFAAVDYGYQRFDGTTQSPRTTSDNVNLTLGTDVRVNDNFNAGMSLNIGQHNADYQSGGGYKLQDLSGLGYLFYHQGGGYIGGYVDFGQDNFSDIERRIQLGSYTRTETGKADGNHLGGGFTGGWWFDVSSLRTGPFATIDWQTVKVNGYNENGNDSSAMWFGRQQRDQFLTTLGWRLEGHWQAGNVMLAPYAELAWNHDDKADPRLVTAGLNSMPGSFSLVGFSPDKNWGTADLGLSAQFNQALSGWVGFNGRFSDSSQKYDSLNVGVKYAF